MITQTFKRCVYVCVNQNKDSYNYDILKEHCIIYPLLFNYSCIQSCFVNHYNYINVRPKNNFVKNLL